MKEYKSYIKSIVIVMLSQALVYFAIKTFQADFHMLSTILEIKLIKQFVYFYDIWYPFIILCSFLIYKHNKEIYKKLVFTMLISAFMAHITFLIYPTMIERPDIEVKTLSDLILYITYKTDTPAVNCLPSVHCLFCFVMSYYILKTKEMKTKIKVPILIVLLLIVLSTLFIKQHIIEDVILSLVYTVIAIIIVKIFNDKLKKILKFIF